MYYWLYIDVVLGLNKILYQYDAAGGLEKKKMTSTRLSDV